MNSTGATIILFAAYSAKAHIFVRFCPHNFSHPLTLSLLNINFTTVFGLYKLVQICSLGGALVPFVAYSVYGGISCAFSHLIFHLSTTLSPSNLGAYKYFTSIP